MGNVSLNLNNAWTGAGAMANFANSWFNKMLKVNEKPTKPVVKATTPTKTSNTKVGTWAAAPMPTTFSWTNISTGATGSAPQITNAQLQSVGRLNPISEEDDLIKLALNDLDAWHPPADVYKAYPEVAKKLQIVADFKADSVPRNTTWDLFKSYPELSDSLKAEVFKQIKDYQKTQATPAVDETIPAETVAPKKTIWQTAKDVWEGMVSYAWGIPKAIAETGLLDNPANWVNEKIWPQVRAIATKIFGKKAMEDYQKSMQKEDWSPMKFSEFAAGSQVWGDPNSKVAKWVSNTMSALEMVSWAGAIKWALKSKALTKAILPEMTKAVTEARDLAKLTRITKVLWKKVAVLSPRETEMKKVAGKVIKSGWTATKNVWRAIAAGEKETDNLIKVVTKANKVIDRNAVKNAIEKVPMTISVKNDKLLAKNYKDFVAWAKKVIDAMPDDKAETLLRARKDIDKLVRSEFPWVFEDAANKPFTDMIKKARNVINETINSTVWWDTVKNSLHKQNLLYDLAENIATKSKSEAIGSTRFSRYLKRNPIIKRAGWIAAGWVVGWAGFWIWQKIIGWGSNNVVNESQ